MAQSMRASGIWQVDHTVRASANRNYGQSIKVLTREVFMFIETYYKDSAALPGSSSERVIPYPELAGEELTVWSKYLPFRRPVVSLQAWFNGQVVPDAVIAEIERAKKVPHLFDQVEIWSRIDDPMAVGVIGDAKPRYFSIVRWGDAELTLAQVKRKLRVEKCMSLVGWIVAFCAIVAMYAALAQST
jgi:hypothetical protein